MATRVQKTVGGGGGRLAGVYNQQAMAGSPSCGAGAGSQMNTPVPGKAAILPPERSLGIADSVESRAAAVGAESPRCGMSLPSFAKQQEHRKEESCRISTKRERQAIIVNESKVDVGVQGDHPCQHKGTCPCRVHIGQSSGLTDTNGHNISALSEGANELDTTGPPSRSWWPMWHTVLCVPEVTEITVIHKNVDSITHNHLISQGDKVGEECIPSHKPRWGPRLLRYMWCVKRVGEMCNALYK